MGSMSASDAAPLPRLGEVFFDVRGESRTMRLSWYADTGVAVFSIWQGGTCTGTFRLPIADLPRMVEALRRGPHGHDDQVAGEQLGSREPRPPAAPVPPPPSRPELLDRDIETGQTSAAVYAPPATPESAGYPAGPDMAGYPAGPDVTGYQAGPPTPGYPPEPPGPRSGYRDQPDGDPGYPATPPPRPGHRGKAPRRRRGSPPAPAAAAGPGHRDVDPASDPGGYPPGLAPAFPDDYPAGPPAPGFTAPRGSRRRGREPDEDPGGYLSDPPDVPHEYSADVPHDYSADVPHEYSGGYQAGPEPGYPGEGPVDYQAEPRYPDEEALAPDYPGEYPHEDRGGRHPAGPPAEYQDEQGYPEYPEPFAGGPPEPARRRGRRRAEPSPDSFPYGRPPDGGGSRQRERYPRRH